MNCSEMSNSTTRVHLVSMQYGTSFEKKRVRQRAAVGFGVARVASCRSCTKESREVEASNHLAGFCVCKFGRLGPSRVVNRLFLCGTWRRDARRHYRLLRSEVAPRRFEWCDVEHTSHKLQAANLRCFLFIRKYIFLFYIIHIFVLVYLSVTVREN